MPLQLANTITCILHLKKNVVTKNYKRRNFLPKCSNMYVINRCFDIMECSITMVIGMCT